MRCLALAFLPLLVAPCGCTLLLAPGEAQCETKADCEARGFSGAECVNAVCEKAPDAGTPVDPVWGCLGDVVEPTADKTKKVAFSVPLIDAHDQSPVTNVTIDLCDTLDLECTGTNPDFPKGLSPGSDGVMHLSVFQGFDGFVRVTGPGFMDSRVFVGRPIVVPPKVKEVRLIRTSDYSLLVAAFTGQQVDTTRGTGIFFGVDCKGDAASGVRFEVPTADANSIEFYLINQVPTKPPTATATDVDGFGGYFNIPAGSAVVRSYRADVDAGNTYIGESSFHQLANTISYVQVAPTPK